MSDDEELSLAHLEAALPVENFKTIKGETDLDEVGLEVFQAAREGHAVGLYAILKNQALPERQKILQRSFQDEDEQLCPPLVIAARRGNLNVVKTLVSKVLHFHEL